MNLHFYRRPTFWLIVGLILLPINIVSVLWYTSFGAIFTLRQHRSRRYGALPATS